MSWNLLDGSSSYDNREPSLSNGVPGLQEPEDKPLDIPRDRRTDISSDLEDLPVLVQCL
jgi:hypothetical protein